MQAIKCYVYMLPTRYSTYGTIHVVHVRPYTYISHLFTARIHRGIPRPQPPTDRHGPDARARELGPALRAGPGGAWLGDAQPQAQAHETDTTCTISTPGDLRCCIRNFGESGLLGNEVHHEPTAPAEQAHTVHHTRRSAASEKNPISRGFWHVKVGRVQLVQSGSCKALCSRKMVPHRFAIPRDDLRVQHADWSMATATQNSPKNAFLLGSLASSFVRSMTLTHCSSVTVPFGWPLKDVGSSRHIPYRRP